MNLARMSTPRLEAGEPPRVVHASLQSRPRPALRPPRLTCNGSVPPHVEGVYLVTTARRGELMVLEVETSRRGRPGSILLGLRPAPVPRVF